MSIRPHERRSPSGRHPLWVATLGVLLACSEDRDPLSPDVSPPAQLTRVRLAEHLVERPDSWSASVEAPVTLRPDQVHLLQTTDQVLTIRLPWPAEPGSELRLLSDSGRECRLPARALPWTAATSGSGLESVSFAPDRFRIDAESMRREDSAEVSHATTMASMIALPDGSSLNTTLPPLSLGTRIAVVARASGQDATPLNLVVRLGPDSPDQTLTVSKDWRPLPIAVEPGVGDLSLQLVAAIAADQSDRRLVIKRIEVEQILGDLILIRGTQQRVQAWRDELEDGHAHVVYWPAAATPTTALKDQSAFSIRNPGESDAQYEHWIWMGEGEITVALRAGATVDVEVEGLTLEPAVDPRHRRAHNPGPALRRVLVRSDGGATDREIRILQPRASVRRRRSRDRLPEPLFGAENADDLHRLEFDRDRKAAWILIPGDRIRFAIPPGSPPLATWDQTSWCEGSVKARLQTTVSVRLLGRNGEVLAHRDVTLAAAPEKESRWFPKNWRPDWDADAVAFLEFEIRGEAFTFGEDGRLITSFFALTPPTLVDPDLRPGGVVLYCIDTLRADHLSLLGHDRPTTPHLEALEQELLIFEDAYSTCSWTRPSTGSLLTGLHPVFHGATGRNVLATEVRTLAEQLHDAGYATGAVVTNPNVSSRNLGFEEGFEDFFAAFGGKKDQFETSAASFHPWVEDWLARHAHEPFFLYIHSVDPHSPYTPPEQAWRRFDPDYAGSINGQHEGHGAFERFEDPGADDIAHVEALYDTEIVESDRALQLLVDTMRRLDLWEQSGWWLTSDHGEEFQERGGWTHGQRAWQEQIHVPFVLKPARSWELTPRRLSHRAQLTDIAPSLCELLKVGDAGPFSGDSLVPVLRGEVPGDPDRDLVLDERPALHSLLSGPYKLIVHAPGSARSKAMLFQLRSDPGEQTDLAARSAPRVQALRRRLDDRLAEFVDRGLDPAEQRGRVAVMSQEEIDILMGLGYLDVPKTAPPGGGLPPPPPPPGDPDGDPDG